MPPRAVLFDFDGVIADTENVHVAAWERTFARMGWDVPAEVCARSAEEDDRAFLIGVFAGRGIDDGDVDGWILRKQSAAVAMLKESPRLYPGVVELVRRLAGRAKLAVVSGTWRENVTVVLASAGLAPDFAAIVAKEDLKAPKPDPSAYKVALRRLRVAASDAVALEDSPSGLESARSAGVRAIAVGHRRPRGEWHGEGPFIESLADPDLALAALGVT